MNAVVSTDKIESTSATDVVLSGESMREKMTRIITFHLAALYIANASFPSKGDLPSRVPPPFNSFGHQLLLDYGLLLKIVWQVIGDIQSALKIIPARKSMPGCWIALAIVELLILVGLNFSGSAIVIAIVAFGIGFLVYQGSNANTEEQKKGVANVRAQALEQLISGNWRPNANAPAGQSIDALKLAGDGTLDCDKAPILIVFDNKHPFPGYGQLQIENLFICRPRKDDLEKTSSTTITEIRNLISQNIIDTVSKSHEEKNVSFGDVVVVHGNSLCIDSPWLDQDKVPLLWLDKGKIENVDLVDKRASVRTYFAAQVLNPKYMTAATFFIRPFLAGNSASCQIAVTTMGPLMRGTDYFRGRLLRHQMEKEGTIKKFTQAPAPSTSQSTSQSETSLATQRLRLLRRVGQLLGNTFEPTSVNVDGVQALGKEEDAEEYSKELSEMIKESVMWPGYLTTIQNLREANSLTFTDDFFGKTETIASIKTLYDQIARAMLDTLDTLGFDISDYRDREGHYSIKAEKIDQLVLGERIQITQSKETEAEKTATETSASPAKSQQ